MANKNLGFVAIYRSVQEHWIWNSYEKFDSRSAWIDLILSANHEEKKIQVGKDIITIHAGQMWTSYVKLANRWKWSKERVYRYAKMLKKDGMLEIDATPNGTLLTIVNYGNFAYHGNTNKTPNETPSETSTKTSNETSNESQTTIYNNINNVNKITKEPAPPRSGGEWQ